MRSKGTDTRIEGKMKYRIQALWNRFRTGVMHPASPAEQVKEMRRAFYAGVQCCLNSLAGEMSGGGELDDAGDALVIVEVHAELQQFAADVKAGKA